MKLWLSSTLLLASCVSGADSVTSTDQEISTRHACPANVPAALAPAADQDLAFALDATGTQNYACTATATGYAWTFVAPEALLYQTHERCHDNDPVIHHFAGPTWQSIDDGSSIVGAKVAGATVDTTAIPWLLLNVTNHGAPTDGEDEGLLTPITSVQRLSTGGGLAPASGCDADHVGATANVPYTARYFFYRTHTRHPERNVRCGA